MRPEWEVLLKLSCSPVSPLASSTNAALTNLVWQLRTFSSIIDLQAWPMLLLNSRYLVFSLLDAWNQWVMYIQRCNRKNWHSEVVFNSLSILVRVDLEFLMDVWFGINREHSCCNLKVVDSFWARCCMSPSLFFMSILAWVRKQFLPVFSILIKLDEQPISAWEVTPGDSATLAGLFCWWFLFRFWWQLVFWCQCGGTLLAFTAMRGASRSFGGRGCRCFVMFGRGSFGMLFWHHRDCQQKNLMRTRLGSHSLTSQNSHSDWAIMGSIMGTCTMGMLNPKNGHYLVH